jgi:hypothetical protein
MLREDIKARIDAIEESYEFFLAYAAQGVSGDQAAKGGGQLREFLARTDAALENLSGCFRELVKAEPLEPVAAWSEFVDVLERDAASARAAVGLVAGQASISSQLVDNLNANVHLRALLTDLFLVDEALG